MKIINLGIYLVLLTILFLSCSNKENEHVIGSEGITKQQVEQVKTICSIYKPSINTNFNCQPDSIYNFWKMNKADYTIVPSIRSCRNYKLDYLFLLEFLNPENNEREIIELESYFYYFIAEMRYEYLVPKLNAHLKESSFYEKGSNLELERLYFFTLTIASADKNFIKWEKQKIDTAFITLNKRDSTLVNPIKNGLPNPFNDLKNSDLIFGCNFTLKQAMAFYETFGKDYTDMTFKYDCQTYRSYYYIATRIVTCYPTLYKTFEKSIHIAGRLKSKELSQIIKKEAGTS